MEAQGPGSGVVELKDPRLEVDIGYDIVEKTRNGRLGSISIILCVISMRPVSVCPAIASHEANDIRKTTHQLAAMAFSSMSMQLSSDIPN